MVYSEAFKKRMIQKLIGPNSKSAYELSKEVGVSRVTLTAWLNKMKDERSMNSYDNEPQSPRDWSVEKKIKIVFKASTLSDKELGEFLRREGLHEAQLNEMRLAVEEAFSNKKKKQAKSSASDKKRIKALEKEIRRKDKALAEVTALLVLQKKMEDYYMGEEEKNTRKKND